MIGKNAHDPLSGDLKTGVQVPERPENEKPFMQARVRNLDSFRAEYKGAIREEVKVQ